MHDVEHAVAERCSDDDHSVCSGTVVEVDGGGIGENGGSFGKRYPVGRDIGRGFALVPFEVTIDDRRDYISEYGS